MALKLDGTPAAPTTIARKRAAVFNSLELAVERERLDANPLARLRWKAPLSTGAIDPRIVVNPTQARRLLAAVAEVKGGRPLVAFFGCMYYAALRPSEALALRRMDLALPGGAGWGELHLSQNNPEVATSWTDSGKREARQLKHRARGTVRTVPCAPPLVALLRAHLDQFGAAADGRLFRGPKGGHVTESTYTDVWQQARRGALTPEQVVSPLAGRPYALRHAAVSTWLAAGVDSAQVAEWAGHSVGVLHRVYAQVLAGRETSSRQKILDLLAAEDQ